MCYIVLNCHESSEETLLGAFHEVLTIDSRVNGYFCRKMPRKCHVCDIVLCQPFSPFNEKKRLKRKEILQIKNALKEYKLSERGKKGLERKRNPEEKSLQVLLNNDVFTVIT